MKAISKIAKAALPLICMGSSVFSQSLDDAKKAIDAEQYQKAKSMLKNLTVTQADKDENYFYLGWVYILQDYPDSAKTVFTNGIAKDPKSALNYAGLGAVARLEKNEALATTNFNLAISNAGKKNSTPYVYVGRAYLLEPANAKAAIDVLIKGKEVDDKDEQLLLTLGNANRMALNNSAALVNYQEALSRNSKLTAAIVAKGILWKYANNFTAAEKEFQDALAIDPNYGPAYREWAETDLRWAFTDPKMASVKVKEGTEHYKKYMSLTDRSIESRIRYADFLLTAGEYKELQAEVTDLAKMANNNLKIYRYLGYAAYENEDYAAGLKSLRKFMNEADDKRVIPRDYLYLGRLQIAVDSDSVGIATLRKAIKLDTTQVDVYAEIAKSLYGKKKYAEAGDAYATYIEKSNSATLNDYLSMGLSYYFGYQNQYFSKATPKPVPDTTLLTKADSAFNYIQSKASSPIDVVALYQARTKDYEETNRDNIDGLAKPYYEKYIELVTAKGIPTDERGKGNLAEAYAYLGLFYELKEKSNTKATEYYTKARELDPTNYQVQRFFKKKGSAGK